MCRINITGAERHDVRAIDGGKDLRNHALGICDSLGYEFVDGEIRKK